MAVKKILLYLLVTITIGVLIIGFLMKQWIWDINVKSDIIKTELIIPTGSTYKDVLNILKANEILQNYSSFDFVAGWMKYKNSRIKPGKYSITTEMSNRQLITLFRSGKQTPINITFNNVRSMEELIGNVSKYIEADSLELLNIVNDKSFILELGYKSEDILTMFIPNTYEFFWNTNANKFFKRMEIEHRKFWNNKDRLQKAKNLNLTQKEVFTLASIVQKETQANVEKSTVASVYLNRLKIGMLLQADPTVVFATGEFGLKRVLNKHLKVKSPYNTYLNLGLPPGPICMPDVNTIDAVLNVKDTEYLYFCAKPDGNGQHAFAKTLRQHNNNANRYWRWLNKNRIK